MAPGGKITLYPNASPTESYDAEIIRVAYKAEAVEGGLLAYRLQARFVGGDKPRLGQMGTARVYGDWVPLIYYALRRPLTAARQWLGGEHETTLHLASIASGTDAAPRPGAGRRRAQLDLARSLRQPLYQLGWASFEILSHWQLGSAEAVLQAVNADTTLQLGADDIDAVLLFLSRHQLLQAASAEQSAWLWQLREGAGLAMRCGC